MPIKPLKWREPQDNGQDFGHEDSLLVADGIGGMYDICSTTLTKKTGGPGFLLWWCYDPFIWEDFATVEEAQAAAEAHWQKSVQAVTEENAHACV